ncbi:hypothetical protein K501DRAFT_275467 [Backusella circina FSU 941]|nr:hypothetical protein K501DRAFT_275467 [Backusella circina FSU 941]
MTNHQTQTLDAAVKQYGTLYSTAGFKEDLDKTMKWLPFHNTKIDKEDPNYIGDILKRNTDNSISISYKEDSLPNVCSPLILFDISKLEINGSRFNPDFYANRYKWKFDEEPSTSTSDHDDHSRFKLEEAIDIEENDVEDA